MRRNWLSCGAASEDPPSLKLRRAGVLYDKFGIFVTTIKPTKKMKKFTILLSAATALLFAGNGCAYLNSTTRHETVTRHEGTNVVTDVVETTHGRAWTFMDANSSLTRFRNASSTSTVGTNIYSPGTFASGINENSSGSNVVNIANSIVSAAITAAVDASK